MFAPQNQQPDIVDAWSGTLQDWYESIDNALTVSEIIPGNYEYSTATSYGNVGDINEGDSTFVDIFCDRFKIISLDNSFISLEQEVTLKVPSQTGNKYTDYYIGYKCSADIIDAYRIYSNTDKIQDVHNARYEWFMFYNSLSDDAKEGSDCFATITKIRRRNPLVPGVYVNLAEIAEEKTITIKIPLRIPVAFFLMLFNLRFYPNWAGKLSIEIFPTYQNLVIAPLDDVIASIEEGAENVNGTRNNIIKDYKCDIGFRNIGETVTNNQKYEDKTYKTVTQRFIGVSQVTRNVNIKLAQYMLQADVFNALTLKYTQVGMLFPIHTVQVRDFTQELPTIDANSTAPVSYNTAATIGLTHCDTMFIVFRQSQYSRTCFINPQITYSVNIDGKYYPNEPYKTIDDSRHMNMLLDSLNVNNSLLTSLAKDIVTSAQPFYHKLVFDSNGKSTDTLTWCGGDNSNFFIGVPFADSEDFMGGISTTGTVQIVLRGDRLATSDTVKTTKFIAPVGIYYQDAFLKVRAMKPPGRTQIEITTATLEQLVASRQVLQK